MSTVLEFTKTGKQFCPAPLDLLPKAAPTAINLSNGKQRPFFHGKGWLPSGFDRRTVVATPALFVRPGCWVRCTLRTKEVLLAKDVSETHVEMLEGLPNVILRSLLPGKMLAATLDSFGITGGGLILHSCTDNRDESVLSGRPAVADQAGGDPQTKALAVGEALTEKGVFKDPGGVPVEWDDVERTRREKVATKHDEAAVPECLWCEHMIEDFDWRMKDGSAREWSDKDREALPGAMHALQRLAFLWWKRKLRSEFENVF